MEDEGDGESKGKEKKKILTKEEQRAAALLNDRKEWEKVSD